MLSKKIINFVKEDIKNDSNKILIDLYYGVGTIGILLSEYFQEIYGYEINSESVELGLENIKLNNIKNYKLEVKDLNILDELENLPQNELVIVDPPRTGLQENEIKNILNFNPKKLIYVSCNPVTQALDIEILQKWFQSNKNKRF